MRFDLYDDVHAEQARIAAYASKARRKAEARDELDEEQVASIIDVSKQYPFFSIGANVALHRARAPRQVVEQAAKAEAKSKNEKRRTKGKKSRWTALGDVVGGIGDVVTKPHRMAVEAVQDVGEAVGRVVGGAAEDVGGFASNIGRLADMGDPRDRTQFAQPTDRAAEAAALPIAEGVSVIRGASRVGLGAAQFGVEAVTGAARTALANRQAGGGAANFPNFGARQEVLEQTTLGAAGQIYRETGKVDLGQGWFPAGEAQKRQAANSQDVLEVDGKAWTFGRGAASLIVEPGSTPYNILSGVIDVVPQVVDPGALGLKALGKGRAAGKALSNLTTEADLARTIAKADPAWRETLEEAAGLVSTGRRTVVPRQVDKYLYSDTFKKVAERFAAEESPYNLWLASDKKFPVDLADELSKIGEPGEIAAALRPRLGLDVQPKDFKGFGMQVTHSAQRQLRAFNVVPDTYLPFDDPDTFVRNLDNSLANAKVMGEERRAIMDEAFSALATGGPGARKRLIDTAATAVRRSLVGYGVDEDIARTLTSYEGELDKVRHYLTNDLGEDVNFDFLVDDAGNPIKRPQPAALVDLLNSGTFLYDPADVRKIRTVTSKLRPLTTNIGFRLPHSMVNALQQTLVKPLLPFRAAFFLRVEGEEIARSMASGTFDSVFDWLKFGASQRTDAKGGWFNLAKEADDLAERLATETLDDAGRASLKSRLAQINDELDAGKTAFDEAQIGRAWKYADFYAIEKNLHRSGNWTTVHKAADPYRWSQGLADETIAMSQDPIIRRVANGGLMPGDRVGGSVRGLIQGTDEVVLVPEHGSGSWVRWSDDRTKPAVFNLSDFLRKVDEDPVIPTLHGRLSADLIEADSEWQVSLLSQAIARSRDEVDAMALADAETAVLFARRQELVSRAAEEILSRQMADGARVFYDEWEEGVGQVWREMKFDDLRSLDPDEFLNDNIVVIPDGATGAIGSAPASPARPGLDGIKDWLRSGAGRPFLRKFEDAYPKVDWSSEAVLDDVLAKARMRVEKLGDNADLREAVATGSFNGKAIASKTKNGRVASEELLERLKQWAADPASPAMQKYEQVGQRGRIQTGDLDEFTDSFGVILDNFYGRLYGKSSDYLSRERVFKGRYWREMEQLAPFMSDAARDEMLVNAAKAGISRNRLRRLAEASKTPAGEAGLEAADAIAKGRALDYSRNLLYDGSRKAQASDTFRAVFLYPEAWREVTGAWLKLATENPQIPRRAQQIVQGARGAGFFYRDEGSGQEMFGYPMPGPLADYLGVEFQGSAQGLSLGTSVIPGMGPVASVVANKLIPNTPSMDVVREILFPYGQPGPLAGQAVPGWAKKLFGATFPDQENDRIYGNTYIEVLRQLVATGDYGTSETEKERLLNDAIPKARAITALRGIMQFVVPSAPQVRYLAETKQGDVVVAMLTEDLHRMQEEDYDTSTERFLEKYGDDAFAYLVGKTTSNVGGQQASTEYGQWERENASIVNRYPLIAGYFGPQGEGYNSTVFQRQEKQGKRDRRSPDQIIDDAQATLAGWIWRQQEAKVEGRTDKAAREWKAQVKAEIMEDFPAWNPDAVPFKLPGRIRQLKRATQDPDVRELPVVEALDIYFEKRQQAIDSAKKVGVGLFQAEKTAYLRDWLRGVGSELTEDFPEFGRVWDQVLRYELREEETVG